MLLKKNTELRAFYMSALALAVPIMLQNGITNMVSLLDNLMVGQLGTESLSGVSIVNQLLFIFNLSIFGATSGAGIFTAQFHGKGDVDGVRQTLRFKLVLALAGAVLALILFITLNETFIGFYLYESGGQGDLALTLSEGQRYLSVMLIGLIPYAISQSYSSTLRETGESMLPLKAGAIAVATNIALNYVLIFGKLGMPALGVQGAAVATTVARFVECGVVVGVSSRNKERFTYLKGLFTAYTAPSMQLVKNMMLRAFPLMVNEMLWSGATAFLAQCYATRGLSAVAAFNIHTTIFNVISTSFLALGVAAGIVIGNLLGAHQYDDAMIASRRMAIFSVSFSVIFVGVQICAAFIFPQFYAISADVQELARNFMLVGAVTIPLHAYLNVTFFTLRSGGRTGVTFAFDGLFIVFVTGSVGFFLSRYTDVSAVMLYILVCSTEIVKAFVGYVLVRKRIWIRNIVDES